MDLQPAVVAHAAQHGFVAYHRSQVRLFFDQSRQVVMVQLDVPAALGLVLGFKCRKQRLGHGPADTGIAADLAAQRCHMGI
jgi:hypothetical protein